MLNTIPSDFWTEPHRVLEPCCGKGDFLADIVLRFLDAGLSERVVLEQCVFFQDINPENVRTTCRLLDPEERYHLNCRVGDALQIEWDHGFDAVIGNPPYNANQQSRGNTPLYNLFIERYIRRCNYLLFVVPSRWFSGGKGLGRFRQRMLARRDIRLIEHIDDARVWFPTINLKGGVSFFLRDAHYDGDCLFNGEPVDLRSFDCLVKPRDRALIAAVWPRSRPDRRSLAEIALPQSHYGIKCNDPRLNADRRSLADITLAKSHFDIECNDPRLNADTGVECFVSLIRARRLRSADRIARVLDYEIPEPDRCWKVITCSAAGSALTGFGYIGIAGPDQIHSSSYISFRCASKKAAQSLASALRTRFADSMLIARKSSQAVSPDTVRWIPLPPLDRLWTDEAYESWARQAE